MKTIAGSALVLCGTVCLAASAAAQTPVGALAIDEHQGDQYGWAVDYETAGAARQRALSECGSGCSVVLTFARCAAYAADLDADSTAVGWAESYSSSSAAQQSALGECSSRGGGSGCIVRVWGCNGPVVEEGLGLDRATRRAIQEGLQAAGFDPGGADGMFGPRTRSAIRNWQTSRGARATGYLDGASVSSLRPSVAGQPTFREREPVGVAAASPAATASSTAAASAAEQQSPPASAELEGLFWQSIVNSTDPADFEAYLEVFPNGVFRRLAENRLAALRSPGGNAPASAGRPVGGVGSPASGSRVSGAGGASFGGAAVADAPVHAQEHTMHVSVTDAEGNAVTGLGEDDIIVQWDGENLETTGFEAVGWPVRLTVFVDNGDAAVNAVAQIREGLRVLLAELPAEIEVGFLTTARQPRWVTRHTTDRGELEGDISNISPDAGAGATFNDALVEETGRIHDDDDREYYPVIIMVSTDGPDGSQQGRIDEMVERMIENSVEVHTPAAHDRPARLGIDGRGGRRGAGAGHARQLRSDRRDERHRREDGPAGPRHRTEAPHGEPAVPHHLSTAPQSVRAASHRRRHRAAGTADDSDHGRQHPGGDSRRARGRTRPVTPTSRALRRESGLAAAPDPRRRRPARRRPGETGLAVGAAAGGVGAAWMWPWRFTVSAGTRCRGRVRQDAHRAGVADSCRHGGPACGSLFVGWRQCQALTGLPLDDPRHRLERAPRVLRK